MNFRTVLTLLLVISGSLLPAEDPDRLASLNNCNPWYPHKDFPKLITPQWVGEEGVEAVIVLAIDDMRDPAKYEQYLRPILNRLKQIDGRAPVSIMTCDVNPDDSQLQSWLGEGLSIECHTIDHPCPILQGGDLPKAKSTYDRCVDLMGRIPDNKPVAFRTPCCDSLNTVSPRFFSEIFSSQTEQGNFLQIDSSVFMFYTSEDESLPKDRVLDANGRERFWKYLPKNNKYGGNIHNNFVNYIKNYPYPYVINNSCWEIPCLAPSDWSAQHLHGINNSVTVEDWKAAIDLTVHKQGCFSLVFHPHGWIKPEQVVEMIDHAVAKHGNKVKFLNFREVAERLNKRYQDDKNRRDWMASSEERFFKEHGALGDLVRNAIDQWKRQPKVETPAYLYPPKLMADLAGSDFMFCYDEINDMTFAIGDVVDGTQLWFIKGRSNSFDTETWKQCDIPPARRVLPIQRPNETYNGFFIHDRHFCWINEDTAKLPDLMYRVSFDEVLAGAKKKAESGVRKAEEKDSKSQISNLKSEIKTAAYDPVPIGAASVDITPDYPVRLTGYGNRLKESEGVAVKIHARALVIEVGPACRAGLPPQADPQGAARSVKPATQLKDALANESQQAAKSPPAGGTYTVLITVDNCGVPLEMTEAVYERIAEKYNIPRQNFVISSTHSHSAPWLRGFAPNIFAEIPDDHAAHLAQYEKELIDKLVEVVEKAIASQRPGHLSYGFGEAGFAMNRRALSNGKWSGFGEVPDGPTDKRVPVLAAHGVDGNLIAVLANYACHCTTETGEFNQISGDWAGFAADMLEADHPGAVALIAIGCGADANPSPRGTHEQARVHGRTLADEVNRLLAEGAVSLRRDERDGAPPDAATPADQIKTAPKDAADVTDVGGRSALISAERDGTMHRINPDILCNIARIDLPLGPIPSRETWEQQAKEPGVTGSRARYFLQMLNEGKPIPTTIPNYPVQTWCFGDNLAMVFLGGEVVVDYSIRMNDMFDSDRLWINAYSNDVPCYIASARVLREGGYECDSSMLYYRRPTRLAPEAEDVLCDAVQKILPHKFYSEKLQQDFPAPKSPEDSLKCMTTRPDLRVVLAASEPLIRDPVAFDWDERGRLWVVEMGDYPSGDSRIAASLRRDERAGKPTGAESPVDASNDSSSFQPKLADESVRSGLIPAERDGYRGRVRLLEDTDHNGVYDTATTFLDNLAFPNGIQCWRGGVIITMAPEIFYAEDTDGDHVADVRRTLYRGFAEGNQQHRINGLRWGLDGWLYLANGDSGGTIEGTGEFPDAAASGRASALRESARGGADTSSNKSPHERLTPNRSSVNLRGRDLRINPDTNELDAVTGQTQFGRERDDFGNWFGNNNSNPIYQYVLEDHYVRRNPHAGISQVIAQVSAIPGAAPVFPTSRTLARFNDFAYANRFTSACSTMIYRDNYSGEQYYGNAFTSEPVHNLVSRLVLKRDGYGFKGERAADELQSEFLSSSDNWFRPTMVRTGPDGAIWVADMYRAVIEHPEWIPAEYQRKMNLYAGSDMGRIYRIVPASECCGNIEAVSFPQDDLTGGPHPPVTPAGSTKGAVPDSIGSSDEKAGSSLITVERDGFFDQPWNRIPIAALLQRLESSNGWWRDLAQRILVHRLDEWKSSEEWQLKLLQVHAAAATPQVRIQTAALLNNAAHSDADTLKAEMLQSLSVPMLNDPHPEVRRYAVKLLEPTLRQGRVAEPALEVLRTLARDSDMGVRLQILLSLGECPDDSVADILANAFLDNMADETLRSAAYSSLTEKNISRTLAASLQVPAGELNERLILLLVGQAAAYGKTAEIGHPLKTLIASIGPNASLDRYSVVQTLLMQMNTPEVMNDLRKDPEFTASLTTAVEFSLQTARNAQADERIRGLALRFTDTALRILGKDPVDVTEFSSPQLPPTVQKAAMTILASRTDEDAVRQVVQLWPNLTPELRQGVIEIAQSREAAITFLLSAKEAITSQDFTATQRDLLLNHRSEKVSKLARELFGEDRLTTRSAVVDDFRSQISNFKSGTTKDDQLATGRQVFEKRCAACHRLQDVGKEVGADLAALKDRSADSLLTAILDPNKAVEAKFLTYTVVTNEGLQYSGMLKSETGGSLTLVGSDGKETTIPRASIEELVSTKRSLMPEGLEKDLTVQDLASVIAFVQSTGTPWKRFEGNAPRTIQPDEDGTIRLPASSAEIYGPNLVFEPAYGNLGFWTSTDDYAKWTFDVPASGHWTVELDFACEDSTAGSLIKFSTGNRLLTARVPGTGSWNHYQTWRAGTIDIHRGRGQLIVTAPDKPPFALIDLKAVKLIPPVK